METPAARVAREDLTLFLNACFCATGQRGFYDTPGHGNPSRLSLDFLHAYALGNWRRLYARTLAVGINDAGVQRIVTNLLASGKETPADFRNEENALITAALRRLPPHRAWKTLAALRRQGVNNRRTRALARDFLATRDAVFDAIKYRGKLRAVAAHAHLALPGEVGPFLFAKPRAFQTPLLETFRRARYSAEAIYELPFTIAEGLAQKHGIPRERFLERIAPHLTATERLRLQDTLVQAGVGSSLDPARAPLTKLALYVLSLPVSERARLGDALVESARRSLRRAPLALSGRVASVLDRSRSTIGSEETRRRPLAVALGCHFLLAEAADDNYRAFWSCPTDDPLAVTPRGQTDLATPLLDALAWGATTVVIVSDGVENDPPGAVAEILRAFQTRLDQGGRTTLVHVNPVFRAADFAPRSLCARLPTIGLRDAEDLPTALGFARFAAGQASLPELEDYLATRVADFLDQGESR